MGSLAEGPLASDVPGPGHTRGFIWEPHGVPVAARAGDHVRQGSFRQGPQLQPPTRAASVDIKLKNKYTDFLNIERLTSKIVLDSAV